MKHCIIINSDRSEASRAVTDEILAGIEEEGFRYEKRELDAYDAECLAKKASRESGFGCGIGVCRGLAALWLANHNMCVLRAEDPSIMRNFGLNAARALKKQPFVQ